MGYVDENLLPNERVVYRTQLHWVALVGHPGLMIVLAIVSYLAAAPTFGTALFFLAVLGGLSTWLRYRTSEFAVTDKRVIIKVGVIRRRTLETMVSKIENIAVNQGI